MKLPRFSITLCLLLVPFLSARSAVEKPNIIFILVDDMGWGDLGAFGNKGTKTPNIDRLAAEGLRFTQFYVNSPICSPSRTALTTGQYPQRWKITSYLSNRAENERRGMAQWLDPAAPSLARSLKSAGYTSGHFGKWHMGGQRDVGEAPMITEYGFDESLTNFEGLGPRLLGMADAHDGKPPRPHSLNSEKLGRGPVIWYDRTHLTEGFVGAAIQFMNKAEADGRPFFINLWPDDVHSPFFPPADRRGDGSKRELYRGVLETMDEQLGKLFDHVRDTPALKDRTLIVFCSDNGHEPGAGTAGPLRGAKGTLYEGGVRSPLIVWGPGLIPAGKAGQTNGTSVFAAFDLTVSLLALSGGTAPIDTTFDGENLSPTLIGTGTDSRKKPIFWRRPPDRKGTAEENLLPDLAMRDGEWKLLCNYDGSAPQLYHLPADAGEATNLAGRHPEVVEKMTRAVTAWHDSLPPDHGPALGEKRSRRQAPRK
ncbi:sulfatase-like hydrolase/transferase [Luteolibacter sp. SL250]|uniref:sulfatase-like hydrolase/transferase n=1 Tax=Luteolibacter sp. SL250 TaxID=2995170 RepID=UPI00226FB736|nr:sulfatase-like hydrolase/transferase [Luteolibacter sp. SL250]WAC21530.1 sulfatase-like hydrolase/transferase [Luteolibacter sp. SL250]